MMFARLVPIAFVLIWSTGWIVAKYASFHAGPFSFLTLRFGCAILFFMGLVFVTRAPRLADKRASFHAAFSGVFFHGLYLGGVWWAISQGVPAGLSGIISALQPLMTALAAPYLIGERLRPLQKAGLVIGFAGIMIAIAPSILATDASRIPVLPLAVNIIAMMAITYGAIYQKQHLHAGDIRTIALFQYIGAFLVLALATTVFERPHFDASVEAWGALAWSVLGLSAGGIGLLLYLLRHGQASQAASLIYMVPPVVALQAWLFFGEPLTLPMIIGAVVAAAGVYLTSRK